MTMNQRMLRGAFASATVLAGLWAAPVSAQSGTVKIAFVDPLSGLMAPLGTNQMRSWQYMAEYANQNNWAGDAKFEIVPFDNKLSPQESLTVLKSIIDQGIRYVV